MLRKFRSTHWGSLYEQWLATVQTTTVTEYRRKFIETASPLERISEEILLGQFLNGLKEEVKAEVRLLSPLSLEQAMEMALKVEEKNKAVNCQKFGLGSVKVGSYTYSAKGFTPSITTNTNSSQNSPLASKSWVSGAGESQASVSVPKYYGTNMEKKWSSEVRRLSDKEFQEKRSKGLCFRCDDKWSIGHRCKKRELSVLLMEGDEEETWDEATNSIVEEVTNEVPLHTEVSLNSVIGLSNPKTMKLKGLIEGNEVVVMIDPGATHNFVSLDKAKELKLSITESGGFGVALGNGEAIRGNGICKEVLVELDGGVVIQEDMLPLSLGTSDVILGVQWLEKLGNVMTNWKSQIMQFEVGDNTVTLVGDPSLVRSRISLKAMIRTIQKEKQGYWIEVNKLDKTKVSEGETNTPEVPSFLAHVV